MRDHILHERSQRNDGNPRVTMTDIDFATTASKDQCAKDVLVKHLDQNTGLRAYSEISKNYTATSRSGHLGTTSIRKVVITRNLIDSLKNG